MWVPNVDNNNSNNVLKSALELLKAVVDEQFECPVVWKTCTDTHINPKCLDRFCGDCIKECLTSVTMNVPAGEFIFLQNGHCGKTSF